MRNDYSTANTFTLSPERCNGSGKNNEALNNSVEQKVKQCLEQNSELEIEGRHVENTTVPQENTLTRGNLVKINAPAAESDEHDLMDPKNEGRFSHERKPSYSSSEKSVSVSSSGQLKGKLNLATCGNVKLRDTSSLNRQRRNGMSVIGLGNKDDQPHSSSGNWSASSESGRASIGSELTIQPKSSASNTSLNCSSFHPGSGPPSSMMSRRRFLNTSASSSVTSEGTATPDLQVVGDVGYPCHLDDETSSAYSCDTEGYYTSFHMDSGLRTLKEEEPTLLATPNAHPNTNYSFGSQHNQTVLSAENEYELFGKGSTSTTTSSAGTVCTTLMANVHGEQSSMNSINIGPDVPERISSLGKLNRSRESNSASTSTLERSYSSSTIGSTLERTGTIKRNVNASLSIAAVSTDINSEEQLADHKVNDATASQEDEFEFEESRNRRTAQPLPNLTAEFEVSESSDLEGVERIERIKQKTALNARRIPSMCIITPTTSDDDQEQENSNYDPDRTLTPENSPTPSQRSLKTDSENSPIKAGLNKSLNTNENAKDHNQNVLKRNSQYGLNNMLEKLKVVLPNIKRSPSKSSPTKTKQNVSLTDDDLYDLAGEYVTIADVTNNNSSHYKNVLPQGGLGIYYSNDIVNRRKLLINENSEYAEATLPAAPAKNCKTEYVSLNELPSTLRQPKVQRKDSTELQCADSHNNGEIAPVPMYAEITELSSHENSPLHTQKRVRLNAQGKIIYDSDSLKRRKGAHTTFAPGPCVKETESALPIPTRMLSESATVKAIKNISNPAKLFLMNGGVAATRKIANVRPIIANTKNSNNNNEMQATTNPCNISNKFDEKNVLANRTNPIFQQPLPTPPIMLPSPSAKSTTSTSSTNTSGSSTNNKHCKQEHEDQQQVAGKKMSPATSINSCLVELQSIRNVVTSVPIQSITLTTNNVSIVNNTQTHKTTATNTQLKDMPTMQHKNSTLHENKLVMSTANRPPKQHVENSKTTITPNNNGNVPKKFILPFNNTKVINSPHTQNTLLEIKKTQYQAPPLPPRKITTERALTPTPSLPVHATITVRSRSLTRCENKEHPQNVVVKAATSNISISTCDPNTNALPLMKNALKRNNSYRLANEDLKMEMNKENVSTISNTLPYAHKTHKNVLSTAHETNDKNSQAHISNTKSFERLMDQFSLSTTTNDSSYLRNKSLENFDEAGEHFMPNNNIIVDNNIADIEANSESDSDIDFIAPQAVTNKYQKSFIENVLLRPFKIIMPHDEGARRQRILHKFEVTEIW